MVGFTAACVSGTTGVLSFNYNRLDICINAWKFIYSFRFVSVWIEYHYTAINSGSSELGCWVSEMAVPWNESVAVRELGL